MKQRTLEDVFIRKVHKQKVFKSSYYTNLLSFFLYSVLDKICNNFTEQWGNIQASYLKFKRNNEIKFQNVQIWEEKNQIAIIVQW